MGSGPFFLPRAADEATDSGSHVVKQGFCMPDRRSISLPCERWLAAGTGRPFREPGSCAAQHGVPPRQRCRIRPCSSSVRRQQAVTEPDALKVVLRKSFRYVASVSMQWVLFGSGGHKDRPAEGQLKGFNQCTGVLSKQMKCLGSSFWFHYRATFRPTHVHQCTFRCAALCGAVPGTAMKTGKHARVLLSRCLQVLKCLLWCAWWLLVQRGPDAAIRGA